MLSVTACIAFFSFCGVASQLYGLIHCISLVKNTGGIRDIVGNELTLLWSCIAGMHVSWTCIHLMTKSSISHGTYKALRKQSINWLPVGTWPQIILWSVFVAMTFGIGVATSTIQYKIGFRGNLTLPILNYIFPVISATMSLPNLAKRLCSRTCQQNPNLEPSCKYVPENNHISSPHIGPFNDKGNFIDNASVNSKDTQNSGLTKCTTRGSGSPHQTISTAHELSIIPSNTTTLAPKSENLSCNQHLKAIIVQVACYSPIPVATALISLLIHIFLLFASIEQHAYATPPSTSYQYISVPALYSDNMERAINISINCRGKTIVHGWTPYKTPQQATILLEHVAGYPSLVSKSIQDELIKHNHRVCMYDRPGYMLSPQGYAPISPVTLERALSSALRIAGEEGPFYLVGHHSGAEYSQIFANINYESVVGMSFIYPTDTALVGLLSTNQTDSIRMARAQAATDSSLLPDTNLALPRLNLQRALAALGTWMTNPPVLSDASGTSQNLTEWALSSPYLAQAQFFELSMQPQLAEIISDMKPPVEALKRLPVKLFGVNPERSIQEEYRMATSGYFKVDVSDPDNLQPLSLRRVAQEIALHISQLHLF